MQEIFARKYISLSVIFTKLLARLLALQEVWCFSDYTSAKNNTVIQHLSGLIGAVNHSEMQKIWINCFFFVNRLH